MKANTSQAMSQAHLFFGHMTQIWKVKFGMDSGGIPQ